MSSHRLCRFRADPYKVRVGVRRSMSGYLATVSKAAQKVGVVYVAFDAEAAVAIFKALQRAEDDHLEGIDLELESTYLHPMARGG